MKVMKEKSKLKVVLDESSPESSRKPKRATQSKARVKTDKVKVKKERKPKVQNKFEKIIKEYKNADRKEIWEAIRDNFIFGFLGAILVVFISKENDLAVLVGYISYYLYMAKIVNRPKYVTDLGKIIIFPFASASGAFVGYKLSNLLLQLI
jgi:hypothetical protein